ncbi:MAG: helix-turn-helix domain-containing protein [Methylococcaceae bacterium]
MAKRYDEKCPVGRVLNVIGDDWSIMILRDLFLQGTCRFQDLKNSLMGPSPNTLSARLKWLESQGIIERKMYSKHPPRAEYSLTDKGRDLSPVLLAMKKWGETYRG